MILIGWITITSFELLYNSQTLQTGHFEMKLPKVFEKKSSLEYH